VFRPISILLFWVAVLPGYAQLTDSLQVHFQTDSLIREKFQTLDSIQEYTGKKYTELKSEYDSIELAYGSLTDKLQRQRDSPKAIDLPADGLTSRVDSINYLKEQKLAAIKAKADDLKKESLRKIEELNLPPEVSAKVNAYTNSLAKLDISLPKTEFDFPSFDLNGLADLSLPEIKNSLPASIGELNIPQVTEEIKQVTDAVNDLEAGIPEMPTVDNVAAKVEDKAGEITKEKIGELPATPSIPTDGEAAREVIVTEVKKQALNHFAGKEQQLQAAMDQMSKYKQKYSSVQSIKDLPKKAPNAMKGKPLRERLVPGLTLQIQRRNDWWFDFNPYLGYRFTGRITAGLGWNHRIPYNFNTGNYNATTVVYGPRAYGEYHLKKGFSPHLEIECLNAPVRTPPDLVYDHREWVWSAMAGMKKSYRISKSLRGNAQVLYNLIDPHYKSPYTDRLNMRMGVELVLKKKQKEGSGKP
jgi:hypothetical protein